MVMSGKLEKNMSGMDTSRPMNNDGQTQRSFGDDQKLDFELPSREQDLSEAPSSFLEEPEPGSKKALMPYKSYA